eukprot:symbB.v1.2.011563.t1/scaffold715.1/size233058/9
MSPLRVPRAWVAGVGKELKKLHIPLIQVDAHNVVPVWEASDKQETGARTLRPKINKLLKEFLVEFPVLKRHPKGAAVKSKGSSISACHTPWHCFRPFLVNLTPELLPGVLVQNTIVPPSRPSN